jgi:hypothetical protein
MKKILFTVLGLAAAITMSAQKYESQRPAENERLFKSEAIELKINEITQKLANPRLAWMFANCFPNTLDTTVHYNPDGHDGQGDTFVITGDIEAMWLRDSGARAGHMYHIPYMTRISARWWRVLSSVSSTASTSIHMPMHSTMARAVAIGPATGPV